MEILHVFLESIYSLAALTVFLLFYLHSSNIFCTQKDGKEPPGPTPLPLIENLLQLDLKRIYVTHRKKPPAEPGYAVTGWAHEKKIGQKTCCGRKQRLIITND
uniref:Uncharacterized protein n=1 Tax=Neolamprologus brichardi TaxID=32507 RepID=A0A3Q4GWW4_NEOBR